MILVTGASGLIGSALCSYFDETDRDFAAMRRSGSKVLLPENLVSRISWREADLNDPLAVERALENITQVVHCAAIVSYDPARNQEMHRVNVEGTRLMVDLSLKHGISRFVHVSSVAALGGSKSDNLLDENTKWADDRSTTFYSSSKYQSEVEVWRGMSEGLNVAIVNPSLVLGHGDWNISSNKIFKYVAQERKYYTKGTVNYVDVRDVVLSIDRLLNSDINGERFVISGGHTKYKDLFELIADKMNKRAPYKLATGLEMKLAYYLEKFKAILTGKRPLVTKETLKIADREAVYSSRRSQEVLGLNYRSLDETLDWCCAYYQSLL